MYANISSQDGSVIFSPLSVAAKALPGADNPHFRHFKSKRLHVVDAAKKLARFKEEPFTAFVLHALANEVRRFESELAQGPVADRVKYHDLLELEALALLTDEEKKECGL